MRPPASRSPSTRSTAPPRSRPAPPSRSRRRPTTRTTARTRSPTLPPPAALPIETNKTATVRIDTLAPATTDNAPAGWSKTAVTVTLTATDASSGVATTEYKVDGAASYTTGTSVAIPAPADHSNDGPHTITYRSTDAAGNTEAHKTATV